MAISAHDEARLNALAFIALKVHRTVDLCRGNVMLIIAMLSSIRFILQSTKAGVAVSYGNALLVETFHYR